MKKRGLILMFLMMGTMSFTSYGEMKPKEVSAVFLTNGEWREVTGKTMYQENLSEGWYNENDTWYYIINGYPVSGLQVIDGKEYQFQTNGILLAEDSDSYRAYAQLLEEMNQVKGTLNYNWSYDTSSMTEYERLSLLHSYCIKYMPGIEDIGQSGFCYTDGILSLKPDADLALEKKISKFYENFSGIEQYGEREKAVFIHDTIIRLFDYDYSLENKSDSLIDALSHNNKIVCGGYAGIFKQVCNRYGLESEVITGYGNGEYHAWNAVRIDEKWRYVDCCWDDTSGTNDWLLKSKLEFNATHIED